MTAKRKIRPSQPVTLHRFFSGFGSTGKTESQAGSKATQRVFLTQEVIVIDSDDDADSPNLKRSSKASLKRRRSSTISSSDVEIVDTSGIDVEPPLTTVRQAPQDASKDSKRLRPDTRTLEPHATPFETALRESDDMLFGKPSHLLPPVEPCATTTGVLSSATSQQTLTHVGEPAFESHSAEIPPDDDWDMGDDEQLLLDSTFNGDESMDVDEPHAVEDSRQLTSCPVCEVPFGNMSPLEMQAHTNKCLDETSVLSHIPQPSSHQFSSSAFKPILPPLQPELSRPAPQSRSCSNSKLNGNAFNLLMSSRKETEAWKEASAAEDRNFRPTKENAGRRKAPFYKVLQGMPIAVDAFRYGAIPGVTAYFLTHAHSDHYTNLAANWKNGPIYCSHGTAKLIIHMLSVDPKWVHPLPFDVPSVIPNTGGVSVTLIRANHCPGSCLFLFEGLQTVNAGDSAFKSPFIGSSRVFRYLHCGDFRASPQHVLHPAVQGKRIDTVYLDTTYLDPKYIFPPQPLVISACAELAKRIVDGRVFDDSPDNGRSKTVDGWMTRDKPGTKERDKASERTLVVVGTYSIGKERIVKAIAHALQTKVYCDARKAAILRCQDDPELHALLTDDSHAAGVHLVPLGLIVSDKLKEYADRFKGTFSKTVGFRPTGWTFTPPAGTDVSPSIASIISRSQQRTFTYAHLRPARNSTPSLQVFGVPYSEHSSFFELTCFALSFDWVKMIATVNVGSETSRGKMSKWVEKWDAERKKRGKDAVVQYREPNYW